MPKKQYILKVERQIKVKGKGSVPAYFAGIEKGSMIYKPNIKDAQIFPTKKEVNYWLKYTGGEVIELSGRKKAGLKSK
jgi:hypothetical protein